VADNAVAVHWPIGRNGELALAANLSGITVRGFPSTDGRVIWREGEARDDGVFGAYAVRWSLAEQKEARHG
jgi:hypothetical protein